MYMGDGNDQQLGDAHSALDGECSLTEIDQRHFYLAAVVGVDRAGRVHDGYADFGGQSRTGTDLSLEPCRNRQRKTTWDERDIPWRDPDRLFHRCMKVHRDRLRCLI